MMLDEKALLEKLPAPRRPAKGTRPRRRCRRPMVRREASGTGGAARLSRLFANNHRVNNQRVGARAGDRSLHHEHRA